jgi:molybdopterin-guanine dinucleotide biosynthesis protein A
MGRDKSLLRLGGRSLTALAVEKLLAAGYAPVFVVGRPKAYGLPLGTKVVKEAFAGQGPLSGLEAALSLVQGPCLILPCDMPRVSRGLLKKLRLSHQARGKATAFRTADGRAQPMPAVYSPALLPLIRRNLRRDRNALYPLLEGRQRRFLALARKGMFANINDPQAWKRLRESAFVKTLMSKVTKL